MSEIRDTLRVVCDELARCTGRIDAGAVGAAVEELARAPRVFLAGAGRSGLAVRGFAMRLMHMGMAAHLVGEVTTPSIGKGDLLVIGSGSGRTSSLLAMARKAKELEARVLLATIDPRSPIAELADVVVAIPAPSPKATAGSGVLASIQPMGSLFEQSLFILCDTMIVLLMRRCGVTAEAMFARHANLE